MIKEGALEDPKPQAIFGLHVTSGLNTGKIAYRSGPAMAGADTFRITVKGQQTHGAMPWRGVDPIVVGAQIVLALQTIQSRQVDVTKAPSVLTIGAFNGGNRQNIIPDTVEMQGTLRTFDLEMRNFIMRRVGETAAAIAQSGGAEALVEWRADGSVPLVNHTGLTQHMLPTLRRVVGADNVVEGGTSWRQRTSHFSQRKCRRFTSMWGLRRLIHPPSRPPQITRRDSGSTRLGCSLA